MGNWIAKAISDRWSVVLHEFRCGIFVFLLKMAKFASGLVLLFVFSNIAEAETRSLKLYYVHTNERAEIVFKKDGRYVASGLKKLNHFLRDWRRNEPTNMDPNLFDLVWQIYKESGARGYIHVVSAYRSPSTNNMLRLKSANSGVAKDSQHTLGKAMDFYIPDVKLERLRQIGLKLEAGGVGYYPKSGSPFIHVDVGNVRHWPRMNRQELIALFPDGKTIHTPSDGKPLAGYQQAMLAHQTRKSKTPAPRLVREEKEKKTLFAALFNKKKSDKSPDPTPTLIATNSHANAEHKIQDNSVTLPDALEVPRPQTSPLRVGQDAPPVEDEIRLIADASQQMNNEKQQEKRVEIAQIMVPPQPLSKPTLANPTLMARATVTHGQITHGQEEQRAAAAQLAYLPQLVKEVPTPPSRETGLEAIEILIAQGEEVEIIPLPDEDLHEQTYTSISTLIMEQDNMDEGRGNADRDVIRQAIAEAVAALEAADQQTVASISKDSTSLKEIVERDEKTFMTLEGEEIRQIPEMVFVSGLQKQEEKTPMIKLTGRAITFPPVARILDHD